MKLRTMILEGFKSFVHYTELELGSGMTCIVGPNGCGKSNIVDAINWALGTRSFELLRSENSMTDVIFHGAEGVAPSSRAEVRLVFDNAAGGPGAPRLNVDAEQVEILRRLSRTGESVCMINRTVCRLKDVRALFAGTGLGPGTSLVIEQGTIQELVRASSQELRRALDEASGIAAVKDRMNTAEQKLEEIATRLTVLAERRKMLARTRESLIQRASRARRYQQLQALIALRRRQVLILKRRRLESAIAEIDRRTAGLRAQTQTLQEDRDRAHDQVRFLEGRLRECELALTQDAARETSLAEKLQLLRQQAEGRRRSMELLESKRNALRRERADVEALQSRTEEEARRAMQELEALKAAAPSTDPVARVRDELSRVFDRLQSLRWRVQAEEKLDPQRLDAELAAIGELIVAARGDLDAVTAPRDREDHLRRVVALERKAAALQTRMQEYQHRRARLEVEIEQLGSELSAGSEASAASAVEEESVRRELEQLQRDLEPRRTETKRLGQALEDARRRLQDLEDRLGNTGRELQEAELVRATYQGEMNQLLTQAAGMPVAPEGPDVMPPADITEADLERELADLERKEREFGRVDAEAPEQLQQVERDLENLRNQQEDLVRSKEKLTAFLGRIRERCRILLERKLEDARREFQTVFQMLFGGGAAEIQLADGARADPLEAGVHVRVRLPGKQIAHLAELSGGEKSLTAIAYVMGLIRSGSAPIAVMDEVDAALDEPNSERFAALLSSLARNTQLIVITHNKRTMMVADRLYGITMQPAGVSRVVQVDLAMVPASAPAAVQV